MSDDELDPVESLLKAHRKEKKDLQGKIQALKKTASKGDKKKKKDVADEIAKLEQDLDVKHKQELSDLKNKTDVNEVENGVDNISIETCPQEEEEEEDGMLGEIKYSNINTGGKSKAQKRREKKEAKEKERLEAIDAQEVENLQGARHLEQEAMKNLLKSRGLTIKEIAPDGDCLFAAVAHQVAREGDSVSVSSLREDVAQHLRQNKEEFSPFLFNTESGNLFSDAEYEDYCIKMATTSTWGGQIELKALASILKKQIEVLQATGPSVIVGEEFSGSKVILTYHRHAYELGEHYNSTLLLP